ncbi:GntR family transcriptional regulator [Leucobacter musarum]|uniref:GntR family transcriptional regulator n=1 Tax=Leucobacter musarum TaxID=1930747 RepID=UPI0009498259|nr:GntR family transcriptional regulator [Leucobacter musarum]
MLIRVDEASERAIYAQIADGVRGEIAAGRVYPGETLPPARTLAIGLGINVHTVLRAYQQLRDEGIIDLRRRRGAVVTAAAGAISDLAGEIAALVSRAATVGISADTLAALIARSESGPKSDAESQTPGPASLLADPGDGNAEVAA